jgi:hypothetical protein
VEERVQFEGKFGAVEEVAELDDFAERQYVGKVFFGSFDPLHVGLVGEVEQATLDIDGLNFSSKNQKVLDFESRLHLAKLQKNAVGVIALPGVTFGILVQFRAIFFRRNHRECGEKSVFVLDEKCCFSRQMPASETIRRHKGTAMVGFLQELFRKNLNKDKVGRVLWHLVVVLEKKGALVEGKRGAY